VTEVVLLRRLTDPQSGALWHPGETASFEDVYVKHGKLPLRRYAQPEEVAAHVLLAP